MGSALLGAWCRQHPTGGSSVSLVSHAKLLAAQEYIILPALASLLRAVISRASPQPCWCLRLGAPRSSVAAGARRRALRKKADRKGKAPAMQGRPGPYG